jgi:diaminohydroxyphosphoribosylaminopyrimidine deaminase/5-amino-6-(5-phosphoribosylamino)uracil reductase
MRVATADLDRAWMRRALTLAERGYTPPNPRVGCVLVRDGVIVGEGYHPFAGQPHAEVFALRAAGERARGATAYVTLEPCCHWGRTPPCTDALIAAGVRRVVVATRDSDVRVKDRGVEILRAAGIEVEVGLLDAQARAMNAAYFHFHETGQPHVTLKAAMTLDGKIATRAGDSQWITGASARLYVHRLRAQSGAVMAGIGTLLADDARLTARLPGVELPRLPLRIVVDSHLRTPLDAAAVREARVAPIPTPLLIATTDTAPAERAAALTGNGVEVLRLPAMADGRVDLVALMQELAQRKIISILVEGGGTLNAALLERRLAHRVLFFLAPKLIGGRDAPTPIEGEGVADLGASTLLGRLQFRRFGPDVAIEADIQRSAQ